MIIKVLKSKNDQLCKGDESKQEGKVTLLFSTQVS